MRRSLHASVLLLAGSALACAALVACGSDGGDDNGSGSSTGGSFGTGSTTGTGSATGTGGTIDVGSGGVPGSGAAAGTGSAPGTGATDGSGGTDATGGAGGTGDGGSNTGGSGGSPSAEPFSFFVTSLAALQELSGSQNGFGGDLRFGETGPGAGLRGADKICTAIAETSMPGNGKTWRAFLSATDDGTGNPVHAINRVGEGPWYDRLGRIVANSKADLQNDRPNGAHADIVDDLPNEHGVPNHRPDPNQAEVDNHDTLTGSNERGELASQNAANTCQDWTTAAGTSGVNLQIGHSWPRGGGRGGRGWIADHNAGGCAPGVNIYAQGGPRPGDYTVGAGGGYGGFYCFALTP